jgi:2-oxoisovalerate dehydrogenase E1 component
MACRLNDPVLFLEHKYLYRQSFSKAPEPCQDHLTPFGKAKVVREGEDITVITYGVSVHHTLAAAIEMEKTHGVQVEVIDLRTIIPYDKQTILASVKKTGKVLVAHEDNLTQGFAGEIISFIIEHSFEYLDAPILRVGSLDVPVPYSPILEKEVLPNQEKILAHLKKLAKY